MPTSDPAPAPENDAVENLEVTSSSQTDTATEGDFSGASTDAGSTQSESDIWKQKFQEVGITEIGDDWNTAADRAAQAYAYQKQQNEALVEQMREYQRMLKYQQQYQQQAPAAAAPESQPPSGNPIDSLVKGWIEIPSHVIDQYRVAKQDAEGNIVYELAPNAPAAVREQVEQARQQRATWEDTLSDPRKLIDIVDRRIQEAVNTQLGNTLSEREKQQQDTQAAERFFAENDWVYEKDPATGQPAIDPLTGNPVYSREGRQFFSLYQQTAADGIQSVQSRIRYALAEYRATQMQRQQAPVDTRQQATQVAATKRSEMLGRTRTPAPVTRVNGVSPTGPKAVAGQSQMTHGEQLVARLKEEGLLAG
jgi:hypothetical protein